MEKKNNKIVILVLAIFVVVVIVVTILAIKNSESKLPKTITIEDIKTIRKNSDEGKKITNEFFKKYESEEIEEGIYKIQKYSIDDKFDLKVYTYNTIIKEVILENKVTFDQINVLTDDIDFFIYYQ